MTTRRGLRSGKVGVGVEGTLGVDGGGGGTGTETEGVKRENGWMGDGTDSAEVSELSSIPSDISDSEGRAVGGLPTASQYFGGGVNGAVGALVAGKKSAKHAGGSGSMNLKGSLDIPDKPISKGRDGPKKRVREQPAIEIVPGILEPEVAGTSQEEVESIPPVRKRRMAASRKTNVSTATTTTTTTTTIATAKEGAERVVRKRATRAPRIKAEKVEEESEEEYRVGRGSDEDDGEDDYIVETKKLRIKSVKKAVKPKAHKKEQDADAGGLEDIEENISPPPNWEEMYSLVQEMRSGVWAPVDTMGCEMLAEPLSNKITPAIQRFQTLVSLMLSSQTKDTVTSVVVRNLQANLPGGLTVAAIRAISPEALDKAISAIGFHNRKTVYLKQTAEILHEKYADDIPRSVKELCELPGVGPKMAHLTMSAAWNDTQGIGVDVHVHRIVNMWGWVHANDPERTRIALEKWLPREKWREINKLLVGFGQTICLSRGPKCGECLLADRGLCRAAKVPPGMLGMGKGGVKVERVVKGEVKMEVDGDGDVDGEVKVKREIYHSGDEAEELAAVPRTRRAKREVKLESRHWPGSRSAAKRGKANIDDTLKPEVKVDSSPEVIPDMEDIIPSNPEPVKRKGRKK